MAASSRDPRFEEDAAQDGDLDLMRRAQAGDADALSLLHARHSQAVMAFLRKRGELSSSLDAMTQEVFLRALQGRQRFNGHSSVKTYLLGIASRVWCEAIAAQARGAGPSRSPQDSQPHECPYCSEECRLTPPEAAACRREREAALDRTLAALPRKSREALQIMLRAGLSRKDAATAAGCSENTYSHRIRHAIQILKTRLGGDGKATAPARLGRPSG